MTDLLPEFVGNTSIRIAWAAPEAISWKIRRFEVEWLDVENSITVGKDVVIGATDKLMDGLEYGTEYEILVTPLGAMSLRGEADRILITTLGKKIVKNHELFLFIYCLEIDLNIEFSMKLGKHP